MKLLLFAQRIATEQVADVQRILKALKKIDAEIWIAEQCAEVFSPFLTSEIGQVSDSEELRNKGFDFVVTLGGDGTILGAVTLIKDTGIPILGINLGRLGFLASIEKKGISATLTQIKAGHYTVEERVLIQLISDPALFTDCPYALNEMAILKRDNSSMIVIHTYVNGDFLNSYWADGLIIATPTGSTAYSLSCGGPIMYPGAGNFILTPVAPHNLNVRPLVIPDNAEMTFEVESRSNNFLCTIDSRFEVVERYQKLKIKKAKFAVRLLRLNDRPFAITMREKLMWGYDRRKHY